MPNFSSLFINNVILYLCRNDLHLNGWFGGVLKDTSTCGWAEPQIKTIMVKINYQQTHL